VEFEVGQHMWLNIQDFKMPNGLPPCFTTKYVGLYEILAKLQQCLYIEVANYICGTSNFSHLETKVVFK
jgi:hypothetical protein